MVRARGEPGTMTWRTDVGRCNVRVPNQPPAMGESCSALAPIPRSALILAEPCVVATDLATSGVQCSSQAAPDQDLEGHQVYARSWINPPEASMRLKGILVVALVINHMVLLVD